MCHNFVLLGGCKLANYRFGILDKIMYNVNFLYSDPEDYNCIFVYDIYIDEMTQNYSQDFKKMKSYSYSTSNQGWGLDIFGITLIPPESLKIFSDIVTKANNHCKNQELELLINMISEATSKDKYLIHYGHCI